MIPLSRKKTRKQNAAKKSFFFISFFKKKPKVNKKFLTISLSRFAYGIIIGFLYT